MGQTVIYCLGQPAGTLCWEEAGLYICFQAQTAVDRTDKIPRLWLVGEDQELCLGVPQPDRGLWRLERRIARRSCRMGEPLRAELRYGDADAAETTWLPWPVEPGLWACHAGEDLFLAAPWQEGHCPLVPMFCLCTPVTIAGQEALSLRTGPELELLLELQPIPAL